MKNVTVRPDRIIGSINGKAFMDHSGAKLMCECGWEEKCMMQDAVRIANRHMVTKHNGGMVIAKER